MKLYKILLLTLGVLSLGSCEKLIEIDPPKEQIVSSLVFENDETAISATTGMFARMMKNDFAMSYSIALQTGLYCDELEYKQSVATLLSIYNNSLIPRDAMTNGIWTNGFKHIYEANAIIEGLGESINITAEVKNQLMGEALFVRAFWNFYLSTLYGDIPLVSTTNYLISSKLRRTSIGVIQREIVNDLLTAKNLLNEKYIAKNSVTESPQRIRPNTFVASALLARIYLHMNEFNKAEEEATRIISNNSYGLSDLATVFKIASKEVIWQLELPTLTNSSNSYEASMFRLAGRPSVTLTVRCTSLSSKLTSLFSNKDKRRSAWISAYTDNSVTPAVEYNYPSKYKTRTSPADEYTTPFRLAEIYLIRAEARAQLEKIDDAMNDIDKIRERAGLDLLNDISPGILKQQLLDSIYIERRRELFCEWGLRWFDIRRNPKMNEIMSNIATQKGITWKPSASLWPIPLNDILNSGIYLIQNEGYN